MRNFAKPAIGLLVLTVAEKTWSGSAILEGVFSREELAAAREGQEAFYRGEADLAPVFAWPGPRPASSRSRKHPYASHFRSELAALVRSPELAGRLREVTGFSEIRFWHDQLLWETPRQRGRKPADYQWHTERSRWKTCRCALMVTAWIPLSAVDREMGPITMVPGSEGRGWIELPDGWEPKADLLQPMILAPGDVSLHCWHTVHGNPPNFGDRPRRVMAAHFACGPIRYEKHGAFSHVNERVVERSNGLPDFEDERVCPLV